MKGSIYEYAGTVRQMPLCQVWRGQECGVSGAEAATLRAERWIAAVDGEARVLPDVEFGKQLRLLYPAAFYTFSPMVRDLAESSDHVIEHVRRGLLMPRHWENVPLLYFFMSGH